MMGWINTLRGLLRRFGGDSQGIAAVEFALVVPVMLLLYVGSVEGSALISMDRRVQSIAGAVGDLVSRSNVTVAACDIKDYFQAASGIMAPYPTGPLQQVVSSVFVKPDGTTNVEWSQTAGGATALVVGKPYPLPSAITSISLNGYVIVSTALYAYTPITGIVYRQQIPLRRENFYLPRFGGSIIISPTSTSAC